MIEQNSIQKIEDERKMNIQKTMDNPIKVVLKWWELKDTILSQWKKTSVLNKNQISIFLDKYENRVIKKRK